MTDASDHWLRQVLDLQRGALLAGLVLCAVACGKPFTAGERGAGGASDPSGGGAGAGPGSGAGGDATPDGGVETGGSGTLGGHSGGGRGGSSSVAGSGGKPNDGGGGNGGSAGNVVVETPPVPLDGLELWFDAEVGVAQTNGAVSSWKDRSGHQRDALQTALNYRPKLGADALNGKPAIVFDGVDDSLKLPTLPGDFSHGVSIFTVAQQEANAGTCTGIFEASNGPEIDDVHLGIWQDALLYEVSDKYLSVTDSPLILGQPQLLSVVHQTTETLQLRRNSNALGEDTFALPTTVAREEVYIGHTRYTDCSAYAGNVAELLVYSRAVSDAELIEIESYLQAKWACCSE